MLLKSDRDDEASSDQVIKTVINALRQSSAYPSQQDLPSTKRSVLNGANISYGFSRPSDQQQQKVKQASHSTNGSEPRVDDPFCRITQTSTWNERVENQKDQLRLVTDVITSYRIPVFHSPTLPSIQDNSRRSKSSEGLVLSKTTSDQLRNRPPFYPSTPHPWDTWRSYENLSRARRIQMARKWYATPESRAELFSKIQRSYSSPTITKLPRTDGNQHQSTYKSPSPTSGVETGSVSRSQCHQLDSPHRDPLVGDHTERECHLGRKADPYWKTTSTNLGESENRLPFWSTQVTDEFDDSPLKKDNLRGSRQDTISVPNDLYLSQARLYRYRQFVDYPKPGVMKTQEVLKPKPSSQFTGMRESCGNGGESAAVPLSSGTYRLSRPGFHRSAADLSGLTYQRQAYSHTTEKSWHSSVNQTAPGKSPTHSVCKPTSTVTGHSTSLCMNLIGRKFVSVLSYRKERFIPIVTSDAATKTAETFGYRPVSKSTIGLFGGHTARLASTGHRQTFHLMKARISYDLTNRTPSASLYSVDFPSTHGVDGQVASNNESSVEALLRQSSRLKNDRLPQNISPHLGSTTLSNSRTLIIDRLINGPAVTSELCTVCNLPVQTNDRYTLIDRVVHRQCFRCSRCGALLDYTVLFTDVPSTDKSKSSVNNDPVPAETAEEKAPGKKAAGDTGERRISVGTERMGSIRNKFETGEALTKKVRKKNAPKIKYAGAESAKTKFMKEATKSINGTANGGPKKPKQFTPPPEGVAVGVLESNPQPRDPDVISAEDSLEPVNLSGIGENTKSLRAKFKHMEQHGGKISDEEEEENLRRKTLVDEFQSVGPEATRNARARWKDIESGKIENEGSSQRAKIDIHDAYGGVYENEPEKFENIARAGEDTRDIPSGFNAQEMKEQFLRNATGSTVVKKDPSKLLDFNNVESGIFENEPTRREDVVRHDDEQNNDYPSTSVKWASEAKNRFMQEASKTQEPVQRSQPVTVVDNSDSAEGEGELRFASQAKQAFLERQRANQEALENKARPVPIDIWGEKCAESGIFENTPASRRADVVAAYDSDEEGEGEEDEDEEED